MRCNSPNARFSVGSRQGPPTPFTDGQSLPSSPSFSSAGFCLSPFCLLYRQKPLSVLCPPRHLAPPQAGEQDHGRLRSARCPGKREHIRRSARGEAPALSGASHRGAVLPTARFGRPLLGPGGVPQAPQPLPGVVLEALCLGCRSVLLLSRTFVVHCLESFTF